MPLSPLRVTVKNPYELREISQKLKRIKGPIRQETAAALKASGKDTLKHIKVNVETMKIRGYKVPKTKRRYTGPDGPGGIRRRISKVTALDVSTGSGDPRVVFRVYSDRLGDAKNVPRHLDSGKRFRHPIMGKTRDGRWHGGAASRGQPWFRKTILGDIGDIRGEIDEALDRVAAKIHK